MMKVLRKKRKSGFTLIELIVVIVILGILAAIAIPRITGFTDDAKVSADEANAKMLNNAVQLYEASEGVYPTAANIGALVTELIAEEYLPAGTTVTAKSTGTITLTMSGTEVVAVSYTPAP